MGIILKEGRILITHETTIGENVVYTSLLCHKSVLNGLLSILKKISTLLQDSA